MQTEIRSHSMQFFCRMFLAAALILDLAPAANAQSAHFVRGQKVAMGDLQLRAILDQFERTLADAYAHFEPCMRARHAGMDADASALHCSETVATRIESASRELLSACNLADQYMQDLMPVYVAGSQFQQQLLLASPTMRKAPRAGLILPVAFVDFYNGLSRRIGQYLNVRNERQQFYGDELIEFPVVYFSSEARPLSLNIGTILAPFLAQARSRLLLRDAYRNELSEMPYISLKKTKSYGLTGGMQGTFFLGELDQLDSIGVVLMYETTIEATALANALPLQTLRTQTLFHEALHTVRRSKCVSGSLRQFDEAQAEIGAVAILAMDGQTDLSTVIQIARRKSGLKYYELIKSLFLDPLDQGLVRKDYLEWINNSNGSPIEHLDKLPAYLGAIDSTDAAERIQRAGSFVVSKIPSKYGEQTIFARVRFKNQDVQRQLIARAGHAFVLDLAWTALEKIAQLEAAACP